MSNRLLAILLVTLLSFQAQAGLIFDTLPNNTTSAMFGIDRFATIATFNTPGTYNVQSIDARFLVQGNASNPNISVVLKLYDNIDINNSASVFQTQVYQGSFSLGNLTSPTTKWLSFNFDVSSANLQLTNQMGVDIQLLRNNVPVTTGIGFSRWNSNGSNGSMTFFDNNSNGLFDSSERGLLGAAEHSFSINGITAVPEPGTFVLCSMVGLIGTAFRFRRKNGNVLS